MNKPKQSLPHWAELEKPEDRIAAFANDKKNPRTKISESETLLSLYKKRTQDIKDLSSFEKVVVRHLGIMLIVP